MKKQFFASLLILFTIALVYITFGSSELIFAFPALVGILGLEKLGQRKDELVNELKAIHEKVKNEKRECTEEEIKQRSDIVKQLENINSEIELRKREHLVQAVAAGEANNAGNDNQEERELRNYSLLGAMAQLSQKGRLEGLEAEMDQEARKEFASSGITPSGMLTVPGRVLMSSRTRRGMAEARAALLASEVGNGSNFVQTDVKDFISALYDKNVLTGLGARMVTGLIGNLQIPKSGGSTAVWEGETDANADGTPAVTNVSASPKRLGAYGLVSKQLLIQANNYDVEQLVQNDIINAINQALQVAGINGAGGDNDQPRGILNTDGIGDVIGGSTGAAPTAAHIIELEEKVATAKADIGTLAFLTNPKMRSKLKRTALDAGSGQFVWDLRAANDLMGYRAGVTTSVPSNLVKTTENLSAIIFGNFADMLILQWGGFDIVLNPYTLAKTNQMEIVINSYWDVVIRNAVSFAAMKDAITT